MPEGILIAMKCIKIRDFWHIYDEILVFLYVATIVGVDELIEGLS